MEHQFLEVEVDMPSPAMGETGKNILSFVFCFLSGMLTVIRLVFDKL